MSFSLPPTPKEPNIEPGWREVLIVFSLPLVVIGLSLVMRACG